jgi:hypothetical protein
MNETKKNVRWETRMKERFCILSAHSQSSEDSNNIGFNIILQQPAALHLVSNDFTVSRAARLSIKLTKILASISKRDMQHNATGRTTRHFVYT